MAYQKMSRRLTLNQTPTSRPYLSSILRLKRTPILVQARMLNCCCHDSTISRCAPLTERAAKMASGDNTQMHRTNTKMNSPVHSIGRLEPNRDQARIPKTKKRRKNGTDLISAPTPRRPSRPLVHGPRSPGRRFDLLHPLALVGVLCA